MDSAEWVRQAGPVILRADNVNQFDNARAAGRIVSLLPGVGVPAGLGTDWKWQIAALFAWRPDAVVLGRAAANLQFWPGLEVRAVEAAVRTRFRSPAYQFTEAQVPLDEIVQLGGVRVCSPALTTLDLIPEFGGDVIDRALRSRRVTLPQLWSALDRSTNRRGNRARRRLLLDSRDEPWSEAERLAHRWLRRHRIGGWQANFGVIVRGRTYYLDIAFRRQRVAIEIDGRLHEDDPEIFESDRERQNALVLAGWTVLRFTWRMLVDRPDYVIATIQAVLRAAG